MNTLFNLENTTILSNVATILGVIVSVVAIWLSSKQSKEQYKISQYENRKEIYDFLKTFKDNWLFYIDMAIKREDNTFNIARNGFSNDEKEDLRSNDITKIVLSTNKHYNYQHDKLNEIGIYYKLSKEDYEIICQLLLVLVDCFKEYLKYANKMHNIKSEDLQRMDSIVRKFYELLESKQLENIIEKMRKEISIN